MDGIDFLCSMNPKFEPYKPFLKKGVHFRLERLDNEEDWKAMEEIIASDRCMFHFLELHTKATSPTFSWNWVNDTCISESWRKKYGLNL